jgi:ribonucleoside-triphosphate reductase
MAIYKIRKRNGAIVTFDKTKISEAIKKAIIAVGGEDFSQLEDLTDKVVSTIEEEIGNSMPDIEFIQDKVEQVLIKE